MPPDGYFVDANLLVLLVAGNEGRDVINRHRRLTEFSAADYDRLLDTVSQVQDVYVTPNTLTEASNLLGQHGEPERTRLFEQLRWVIDGSKEITVRSVVAAANPDYLRLGLTDATLLEVATADTPVITRDVVLYIAASEKNPGAALNFEHIRRL